MKSKEKLKNNVEKLNIQKGKWKIRIILFSLILLIGFEGITILIKPSLIALCKVRSESLANSIAGKTVQEVMSGLRLFRFDYIR